LDNCKVDHDKLTKGRLDEIIVIRWDHPLYSPDAIPFDF
jgi:hypothetical protein